MYCNVWKFKMLWYGTFSWSFILVCYNNEITLRKVINIVCLDHIYIYIHIYLRKLIYIYKTRKWMFKYTMRWEKHDEWKLITKIRKISFRFYFKFRISFNIFWIKISMNNWYQSDKKKFVQEESWQLLSSTLYFEYQVSCYLSFQWYWEIWN